MVLMALPLKASPPLPQARVWAAWRRMCAKGAPCRCERAVLSDSRLAASSTDRTLSSSASSDSGSGCGNGRPLSASSLRRRSSRASSAWPETSDRAPPEPAFPQVVPMWG